MPSRNTIEIRINAQDNASDILKDVVGGIQGIGDAALNIVGAGLAAGSAAILGFGIASVGAFQDFQEGISEVFTLLPGITDDAMREMESSVQSFMEQTGRLSSETIPALYQALSAGVPKDNVFDFLTIANKAAVGGATDLETAVNGITSAVNAYGAEVLSAGEASDIMFTAVRLGKTTFEELSASMFQVTTVAAGMGVAFSDVLAGVATLTSQGVPTSVAMTQIRQALLEMNDAGTEIGKKFTELAGTSFADFIAQGHTLAEAFQILADEAERSGIPIEQMFGSVEAGQAALALTGANMDTFTNNINEMGNAAGATEAAFATMNQTLGAAMGRLAARWESLMISMGRIIEPFITPVIEAFSTFIAYLAATLDTGDALNDWLSNLPSALRPIAAFVGDIALGFMNAANEFGRFISAIAAGVSPLTAFQTFLYNVAGSDVAYYFGQFAAAVTSFFSAVQEALQPVIDWVLANVELQDVLIALGIAIASVVIPAVLAFFAAFAPLAALIVAVALLRTAWEENWGGIQEKMADVMVTIGQLPVLIPYWLNVAAVAAEQFGVLVSYWLNQASVAAQQLWFLIQWAFGQIAEAVSTVVWAIIGDMGLGLILNWILDNWEPAWQAVVGFFNGLWDAIVGGIQAFQDGIWGAFQWIQNNVLTPAQMAWDLVVLFFTGLWNSVSAGIENFKTGIAAGFDWVKTNVIDPFMASIQGVVDAITGAQNAVSAFTGVGIGGAAPQFNTDPNATYLGGGGFGAGGTISGNQFGGRVTAGTPTIVGEGGRELFVPDSDGQIMNNRDTEMMGGSGGKIQITFNFHRGISDQEAQDSAYKLTRELRAQGINV